MRRRRSRWLLGAAAALLTAGAATAWLLHWRAGFRADTAQAPRDRLYQCSMHPEIVAHAPGSCPICGMQLEPVDEHPAPPPRSIVGYRHPMRPDVMSPVPAKDEMGMDYVPVYAEESGGAAGDVPGHAPFELSAERQQLIGVRRGTVERRPLTVEIRTVGQVAYDPALYQTFIEYQEARRVEREIAGSHLAEAHRSASALVAAARLKLRQKGVSEAELADAARSADLRDLLLPGKAAWIYAQVYEYEVDLVRAGQRLAVSIPSVPNAAYEAQVVAVDPILDATTRTARVRARIANADGRLRPESFVRARIEVPLGEQLAMPRDAVIHTGDEDLVFVVRGDAFEPRHVILGRQAGDWYELLGGASAGERVVTSANFLIDSESRFRAAARAFTGAATAPTP